MHTQVPNCLMHPLPGEDLDPVGQRLRALEAAIDGLKEIDIKRLYGDSVALSSAAIMVNSLSKDLTGLANEVVALHETRRHLVAAE